MRRAEGGGVEPNAAVRRTAELKSVPAIDPRDRITGHGSPDRNRGARDRSMCLRITDKAVPRHTRTPATKEITPVGGACQMKVANPLPIDERLVIADRNERCVAAHVIAHGGHDPRGFGRYRKGIVESNGCAGDRISSRIVQHPSVDAHIHTRSGCNRRRSIAPDGDHDQDGERQRSHLDRYYETANRANSSSCVAARAPERFTADG